jgi:ABC-type transporter Mla subunit MlaD
VPPHGAPDAEDHVARLLETVSALTAAQAEQAHDLSRLLEVLERLTAAQEDAFDTLVQLEARLTALDVRAAGKPPAGDPEPPERG